MYASFHLPGSRYYVGLIDDQIAGGGGIYPSPGLPENVCEMVKMYLYGRIHLRKIWFSLSGWPNGQYRTLRLLHLDAPGALERGILLIKNKGMN